MKALWPILIIGSLAVAPAEGASQVVQTPSGPVEFIGLKRWSVDMIRDTMAVRAPGKPLAQCAAVLQREIGFPSASSSRNSDDNGRTYVVVTVVEPQHSGRVREKPLFRDSLPDAPPWREAMEAFRSKNPAFQRAVSWYAMYRSGDTALVRQALAMRGSNAADIEQLWRFFDRHRSETDFQRAVWTLNNDGNLRNRVVAAAVLGSFGDRDLTWWTLLDAQRNPEAAVAATAAQVLQQFAGTPRRVDWAPAQASVRHMLNGTNVFLFLETIDVLRKTGVDPALAPALLRDGGGDLLLAHLKAEHKPSRDAAHAFLVHLAKRDLGSDRAKWARWVEGVGTMRLPQPVEESAR